MAEFKPFPKLSRWRRDIVITEKLDGTNASIHIETVPMGDYTVPAHVIATIGPFELDGISQWSLMSAGSRTRWVTPQDDNAGFARWAQEHANELFALGNGHHFGEWWGKGIQRGYGVPNKRFSLFNSGRWFDADDTSHGEVKAPDCCSVVPVLYRGPNQERAITNALQHLEHGGSWAAPGFMDPEGIVIYHSASGTQFKKTLKKDESPKGANRGSYSGFRVWSAHTTNPNTPETDRERYVKHDVTVEIEENGVVTKGLIQVMATDPMDAIDFVMKFPLEMVKAKAAPIT